MRLKLYYGGTHLGYIAGTADGIVTIAGAPTATDIVVLHADSLSIEQRTRSLKNGHYLIAGLDPNKSYLVLCRDYKREYEPCAYDYVQPAVDLTVEEQRQLWESWQTL